MKPDITGESYSMEIASGTHGKGTYTSAEYTLPDNRFIGDITMTCRGKTSYSGSSIHVYFIKNGTSYDLGSGTVSANYTVKSSDKFQVQTVNGSGGSNQWKLTATGNLRIRGSNDTQHGIPKSIVGLGNLGFMILFGVEGGDFFLGEDDISEVLAGANPLPNAIGFLKIGKYKIPYYL